MEKYQNEILALHSLFWKEFLSDMINTDKIRRINERLSKLTNRCLEQLENLMANHSNNKTLLRFYGSFVENVLFNNELANELYQDASSIEDEDTKKVELSLGRNRKTFPALFTDNQDLHVKRSSVVSKVDGDLFSGEERRKSYALKSNSRADFFSEDGQDSFFGFDASENPEMKRKALYKGALSQPNQNYLEKVLFWVAVVFSITILLAGVSMSLAFSVLAFEEIPKVQKACKPIMTPLAIISDIRLGQLVVSQYSGSGWFTAFSKNNITDVSDFNKFVNERLQKHVSILEDLNNLAETGSFSDTMYGDYISEIYPTLFPSMPHGFKSHDFTQVDYVNISISQITRSIIRYTSGYINNGTNTETLNSYAFMFFW